MVLDPMSNLLSDMLDSIEVNRTRIERLFTVGTIMSVQELQTCSVSVDADGEEIVYDDVLLPYLVDVIGEKQMIVWDNGALNHPVHGAPSHTPHPTSNTIGGVTDMRGRDNQGTFLIGRTVLMYTDNGADNAARYVVTIY